MGDDDRRADRDGGQRYGGYNAGLRPLNDRVDQLENQIKDLREQLRKTEWDLQSAEKRAREAIEQLQ